MSTQQEHDAQAFEVNLALRLGRLMVGNTNASSTSKIKDTNVRQSKMNADGRGTQVDGQTKQQRPATAPTGTSPASSMNIISSRPTLFAAAARVIQEQEKGFKESSNRVEGRSEMRSKLQSALRHPPQLKAMLRGLHHLFSRANAASLAGHDGLIDGAVRGGSMSMVALEGWAQVLSHEISSFRDKPFGLQLRDMGARAHEHKALLDTLVREGTPLLLASDAAAAGTSVDGAAAAAAWAEAVVGDDCEVVQRCAAAMPVVVVMQDGSACSALHLAAASGSSGVVSFLLGQGASLWSRDCWGRLPVHTLCIGACMSEFVLRRQQATTAFVNAFVGLELDGSIPCNDSAARIMAGKEHDSLNDNCWLRCIRRMLEYSGARAVDIAVSTDDKGVSCVQYAAAADCLMQLGVLHAMLQRAVDGGGARAFAVLRQHKQQLLLTAKCLGHAAAHDFVSQFLDGRDVRADGGHTHVATANETPSHHHAATTKQQELLQRRADALQPSPSGVMGEVEEGLRSMQVLPEKLKSPQSLAPESDPRYDMMKFR
jgi:hypothetical protein